MELWSGDAHSAHEYVALMKNPPLDRLKEAPVNLSAFEADRFWGFPAMAEMSGDIAIVKIGGTLISGSAGWKKAFGYLGYEDIKAALIEAAGKSEVKGLLLYFDTGGGAVNGVEGTARLISELAKFKPTVGYAATAASAGYWLASGVTHLVADNTSTLGSLGTIIQLANTIEMYGKEGIKYETIKSGALKMAGNPLEEMTPESRAYFETLVNDMTSIFYGAIAKHRGMDATQMRATFGDGRSVLGIRALAGGLIDEIGGVGAALAKVKSMVEDSTKNANLSHL